MKKLILFTIFPILLGVSLLNAHDCILMKDALGQHPWTAFLSNLPEDSWLRKKCENDPCKHCNDIAVAVDRGDVAAVG